MKWFAIIALLPIAALAANPTDLFTWPVGMSNKGPYTLVSTVTNVAVFTPSAPPVLENDPTTHQYNHHTRISYQNGTIFFAFSSAYSNEADSGMQSVVCVSTNHGVTWTTPVQVVPSQTTWTNDAVSAEVVGDRISYPRNFTYYNGTNYLTCAIDHRVGSYWGVALASCPVYTNGTIGAIFRISSADYTPSNGVTKIDYNATLGPPLMADSKLYGCWGGSYPNSGIYYQEWQGWLITNTDWTFVEPNTVSMDGSTNNYYRLWRRTDEAGPTGNQAVFQQYSTDGGASWSFPSNTTVPNAPSETFVLRLTNGCFAIVGNSANYGGAAKIRDPLFLALTDADSTTITNVYAIRQGMTQTPTYPGRAKEGEASYVSAVQVGNYLYVGYSICKESIGFSRVLMPGYADNNNDGWPTPATPPTTTIGRLTIQQLQFR